MNNKNNNNNNINKSINIVVIFNPSMSLCCIMTNRQTDGWIDRKIDRLAFSAFYEKTLHHSKDVQCVNKKQINYKETPMLFIF